MTKEEPNKEEVSSLFINFIDQAFEDLEGLTVTNSYGKNITKEFVYTATSYHNIGDYRSIQNMIKYQDLSISHQVSSIKRDNRLRNSVEPNAIRGENVSKRFYKIAKDSTGRFPKEWVVTLSGNISYDTRTYKITHASGPRVSLTEANFGQAFSPRIDNVTTSRSYKGSTATFKGSYTMKATLGLSIGSLPVGYNLNFGNHTHTFKAHPSVLQ